MGSPLLIVVAVAVAFVVAHAATTVAPATLAPTGNGCSKQEADIHFLIDASGSVGADNFKKQLDFIKNFVKGFDIGPNAVQIGLTTFSGTVVHEFWLNDNDNKADILAALDNVTYTATVTRTDLGMQFVRENAFTVAHGDRPGIANIVIVTTDGQSTKPDDTKIEADLLHKNFSNVFAIGIGSGIDKAELGVIASKPENVYTVDSFDALAGIQAALTNVTCGVVEAHTTDAPGNGCSTQEADIHFLIDASGSVGAVNFQKQLDFIKNFVSGFNIGPNAVQIGLTTFSGTVANEFWMNTYGNKADIISALDRVNYTATNTMTDLGMQFVRQNAFKPAHGRRRGIANIVIVTTDGQSTKPNDTKIQADLLHKRFQNVFAIGIGSGIDKAELGVIASKPENVYTVDSFDALAGIQAALTNVTCEAVVAHVDPLKACVKKAADIHFLIDASGSVGAADFKKQLDFIKDFVSGFEIGPDAVQVGLTTFATGVQNEFWMGDMSNKTALLAAIDSVNYSGGVTATELGMKFVRKFAFEKSHGARDGVADIIIVTTDGQSTHPNSTALETIELHKEFNNVFAIGIGSGVNQAELGLIASSPDNVYNVDSYDALHEIATALSSTACEAVVAEPGCGSNNARADIHFLLDASGSVGTANYQKQLDFVKNFANSFHIGANAVQIGVTTFSSTVHHEFWMNENHNKQDLLDAMDKVQYTSGTTHTELGLEFVRENAFTPPHGDRPGVANILIVVTDGQSTDPASTKVEADDIHKLNINILSIGVGAGVDKNELATIASNPSNVYTVSDFDALNNIKEALKETACTDASTSKCNAPIDLVFLVDKSASINAGEYALEEQFVEQMINQFHIGPNEVQVSLAFFANYVRHQFCFHDHPNQTDVIAAVKNATCPDCLRGHTATGHALHWATNFMLTAKCGARPNAHKVVVVLTDGHSTEHPRSYVNQMAHRLQSTGASVIAIGVGNVRESELHHIASEDKLAFTAANFDELMPILQDVADSACDAPDYTPICESKIDLTFLIDKSASIDEQEFIVEEGFIEQLVGKFNVQPNGVHVALGLFAIHPHLEWCFNNYTTQNQVISAVQNLTCPTCGKGKTGTGEAFQMAREQIMTPACGMRPNVSQVVVLLTDGQSTENYTYWKTQSDLLKATGAQVVAVGVGVKNHTELEEMASNASLVFTPTDFTHLLPTLEAVSASACSLGPSGPPSIPGQCAHQQLTKACSILQKNEAEELVLAKVHPDGHKDHATAYDNIKNMCEGRKAVISGYSCPACETGAPGGTVCITNWVLDYVLEAAKNGSLIINQLTGGCEECNSPHYQGLAVDLSAPGRNDEFMTTCINMGGVAKDNSGNSTMCDFSSNGAPIG